MSITSTSGLFPSSTRFGREPNSIPLQGVQIYATVRGLFSKVTVVQTYKNTEKKPLEAVYVFPLEEGSTVCGFEVTIGERRIIGKVKPRDEAFDIYDDAFTEGHGAFLLDQERPNIFTASVGNILPDQMVEVSISYIVELSWEADSVRLMIPTTVSPRYTPHARRTVKDVLDIARVNPPVTLDSLPYSLQLQVSVDLHSPLKIVESPSHKVKTVIEDRKATISLSGDEGRLDRDFVLLLTPVDRRMASACQVHDHTGMQYVMASFIPDFEQSRVPVDVTFLVDCSGSMQGASMEEARRTLLISLQSLQEGDYFNIFRFGSTHEQLYPRRKRYDDTTLNEARGYIQAMQADLGGTELLTPLKKLLSHKPANELPRRILLFTDGQVANEDKIIELVSSTKPKVRIFSFGIGAGSSEYLVRGVSRASGGSAEFIFPGEQFDEKVMRHFGRITAPDIDSFQIEWEGIKVRETIPSQIPTLYAGETFTVFGKVLEGKGGTVSLSGKAGSLDIQTKVPIQVLDDEESAWIIPRLWARNRIRELEEGTTRGQRRGSQQQNRKVDKVEQEIVQLATTYQLMSSKTSFVAVEERTEAEKSDERAELRQIPTALTTGWGGLDQMDHQQAWKSRVLSQSHHCYPLQQASPSETLYLAKKESRGMKKALNRDIPFAETWRDELGHDAIKGSISDSIIDRVLLSQNAAGYWDLTEDVLEYCGISRNKFRSLASRIDHTDSIIILATVSVLVTVKSEWDEVPSVWKHVIQKARKWLTDITKDIDVPEQHGNWEEWGEKVMTGR
ncbi:VIT domain-containing protein [Gemmatimonadota bacterium]